MKVVTWTHFRKSLTNEERRPFEDEYGDGRKRVVRILTERLGFTYIGMALRKWNPEHKWYEEEQHNAVKKLVEEYAPGAALVVYQAYKGSAGRMRVFIKHEQEQR